MAATQKDDKLINSKKNVNAFLPTTSNQQQATSNQQLLFRLVRVGLFEQKIIVK